ncbi:biotin/lipoate--protein ligase family protein [Azospirillum rugosum]|uniref:Biotin-(Acetyl-CoA carboxylase) ligase n=1 Tax=Azospirillum rugosum TaxID=416170 RepID=A0ABS4SSJ4_9PROT|nr:biotin/lipoate--protein ligase family protein [Azospirillum rugosum]MBP2295533.1 biotin-(acetyl-CoA carboxylase) ligase [Azospirillum rugosum]MDQ0528412.1 biotin-(acetyl-CoA carboxylase) ligase [Azospirillum rugosum]
MHMFDTPTLPPVFHPQPVADRDPFDAAVAEAAAGGEPGTLFWTPRRDRLEAAVVLAPDRPLADTRHAVAVTQVALADALEALGPPNLAIAFDLNSRILLNGAAVGEVAFAAPPGAAEDAVPDWAVVGVRVDVLGDPDDPDPGLHPDRTALREEGFGDMEAPRLLESFARHVLFWMNVWENDGFEPVRRAWQARALDRRAS